MRLGISVGDIGGIGPEIIIKALPDFPNHSFTIFCDKRIMGEQATRLGLRLPDVGFVDVFDGEPRIEMGRSNLDAASLQLCSFTKALDYIDRAALDAVVTAPWNKALFGLISAPTVGHTDVLVDRYDAHDRHVMMLAGPRLRVVLVTTHIPLSDVARNLTQDRLLQVLQTTVNALRTKFGVARPTIAVCGLNPHAGEEGTMGREEIDVIIPALAAGRTKFPQAHIVGPLAADTLFPRFAQGTPYDAVVAMYHDQGLIPLKTLHFGESVNLTLGLPIIRTSVDHGTAYDIAGQGVADASSMRSAIRMAVQLAEQQDNRFTAS